MFFVFFVLVLATSYRQIPGAVPLLASAVDYYSRASVPLQKEELLLRRKFAPARPVLLDSAALKAVDHEDDPLLRWCLACGFWHY